MKTELFSTDYGQDWFGPKLGDLRLHAVNSSPKAWEIQVGV
jgi:hypothetical protein